ncbi:hypothetical protein CJ030_MR6G001824 [Morella rubra]|uniref:Uncharacterized protein n=1 Tax=Morella rubra TaxID=262757 RepID=A0A6A1UQN4_9ROSI|nr:hypothetical protein CJ030_MR8G000127 [Morella rubra]KAB1209757.1 hypothetical protein CJ030_MR6G001824 [Morella rubra]
MHDNSGGVKEHNDGATTWPRVMAMQPKVHGELIQIGSRSQEELIGGTTTRPLDAAMHGGAHKRLDSKDSGDRGDQNDVTTLHGGGVVATTTTSG